MALLVGDALLGDAEVGHDDEALANAALGAWWLDRLIGLLIAAVALNEGREAWSGEGCACTSDPLAVLRDEDCHAACCSSET